MKIKKYFSMGIAVIFTSVAMQVSLFAPKKVYADVQNSSYTISTIAGTGTSGYSGDGGAATSAQLSLPYGVAADSSGNVYIADNSSSVIRKVDTSGKISTIAGTGAAGYSGDGGAATSAQLAYPYKVAVDGSGNIYISDTNNCRVRKIDTSGKISTIAGTGVRGYSGDGGAATSAQISYPRGLAVDSSGNIYIVDGGNNVIRKVDASGKIGTIAGTGTKGYSGDGGAATSAQLNNICELAVDSSGNVYIADTYNHRIRKIDTSGKINTIAGTGVIGYSGDGGAATSAKINYPYGVAVDSSGSVYIADGGNFRVRKIDTSGKIITIAGTGASGYSGDGGAATSAVMNCPYGLAADSSGNIYVTDYHNCAIRKLSPAASTYTVTYDGNGNTSGKMPTDSTSYTSGASVIAGSCEDTAGYKFEGWNTAKDGTGTAVWPGGSFNITVNTTLYAQWTKVVPASGLTVTVAPESTPVQGKVNLTITPGAEDSHHQILYRIVDSDPIAQNVDDEAEPGDGWIEVTDTNAHEISVANGKYIEAIEVGVGRYDVTKWGKSSAINDGYVVSSSLSPTSASFDKNPANAKDISINMTLNGNTLEGIRDPLDLVTSGLVKGIDYTVDGSIVTIKKSYLQNLAVGIKRLLFNFSAGNPQGLSIEVADTTARGVSISPTSASFDKNATSQADINVSMGLSKYELRSILPYSLGMSNCLPSTIKGNTITIKKSDLAHLASQSTGLMFCDDKGNVKNLDVSMAVGDAGVRLTMALEDNILGVPLTDITNEGNTLVKGTDYIVNGSTVTIKRGFLTKVGTGTVNLVFSFGTQNLAVTMSTNQTDVSATMTLYENALVSITNGAYPLVQGTDYDVNGNVVTIKKNYLNTLSAGTAALVFNFGDESTQTLNVAISGTTTKSYTVTFKDYDGKIIGEPQTVKCGESATAPTAPTRTGYVFEGWDKKYNNITEDLIVTATYTSGHTYDFPSSPSDNQGETKIPTDYLKSRDNTLVITNTVADLTIPASAIDLVDSADHIKVIEKVVTPETNTVQGLFSNLPSNVAGMVGNPIRLNVQLLDANDALIKDIHEFSNNKKVKVTIKLTAAQIASLDASKLSMYYYDETSRTWVELGGSFDPSTREFTFDAPHFTNFAIMNKVSAPAPSTGNTTPSVNSYTVTFKDYNGTVIGTPQAVNYGGSAVAPTAPTRTGYVFAGWDKTFDKVTGDLVVTAKYTSGNTYNFKPITTSNGDETKISADYLTSRDNTLVINRDGAEISIPAGAIDLTDGTNYIKVTEQSENGADVSKQFGSLPNGLRQIGSPLLLSIQLFDANNNYIKDIKKLSNNEKIKVTMKFTDDELKGIAQNGPTMYYYDQTAKAWAKLEGNFDSNKKEMTFYMTSL